MHDFNDKFEHLLSENKRLKKENEDLKVDKVNLSKRIESKDSESESIRKSFKCDKCESKKNGMADFLMHMKYTQKPNKEAMHNCGECNLSFKNAFDLTLHNSTKHTTKVQGSYVGKIDRFKFS